MESKSEVKETCPNCLHEQHRPGLCHHLTELSNGEHDPCDCEFISVATANYTANDDTFPTEIYFANGRTVGIAFDGDKPYLTIK